jgi:hypothetical protein
MPNGKLDEGNLKLLGVWIDNNKSQNEEETHKRATADKKADASATIGGDIVSVSLLWARLRS